MRRRRIFHFIILSVLFVVAVDADAVFQFSGHVQDSDGKPVKKAIVRLQGTQVISETDSLGRFSLKADTPVSSRYITAAASGFYNGGELLEPVREYLIKLKPLPSGDNKNYRWLPSLLAHVRDEAAAKEAPKPCVSCHRELAEQWSSSTHSRAATNPVFLSFFTGRDSSGSKDARPGYKTDFPNSNGNCATCHLPEMALSNPFNSDPLKAQGTAKEGISCDLCHKISDTKIDKTGGYPGTLSMDFTRPPEGHQVFYGSYDDVFPGDDSYLKLYRESRYCAPCHNGKFWEIPVYSEYQEWAESSYARRNIHCQDCHMVPDKHTRRFAAESEGGVLRDSSTVRSHAFTGISDKVFMQEAISLDISAVQKGASAEIVVIIKNTGAGHHYPTGSPMRQLILLVEAVDEKGNALSLISGSRVPAWGGSGPPGDANYAGLPGKGFAKVLRDAAPYPDGRTRRHFRPQYPAPQWRPAVLESDNRIPANGLDTSKYAYRISADTAGSVTVSARLIYRRAFKQWMDAKDFELNDLEVAGKSMVIRR